MANVREQLAACVAVLLAVCAGVLLGAGPARAAPTPQAAFSASWESAPQAPLTYQVVTFESTSVPAANAPITAWSWELNGDGIPDASGPNASFAYPNDGKWYPTLTVTDERGRTNAAAMELNVLNRRPVAQIVVTPQQPMPGENVTFSSASTDNDGTVRSETWDLDADGQYDDGSGPYASRIFDAPGTYAVRLHIVDDDGATGDAAVLIGVGQGAGPPQPIVIVREVSTRSSGRSRAMLTPFPIVRISGVVATNGIRLRLLSVNGPAGATVTVRCRGGGCPFERRLLKLRRRSRSTRRAGAVQLRVHSFARRLLHPGATVRVYVTKRGAIGKYTRLRVRRAAVPARIDRCALAGKRQPVSCPSG